MMTQPELGKKIAELRKAKGLTQEELVDLCNISVRTIQRIETGEVTPRSYTVKTILGALGYDLSRFSDVGDEASKRAWWEKLLWVGEDLNAPTALARRRLSLAWICGVAYFFLGIPESIAEYIRFAENEIIFGKPVYVLIKIVSLITYFYFMRGIVVLGALYRSSLLKITAVLLICATVAMVFYDIASVFYEADERIFALSGFSICFGALGIVFGGALYRVRKRAGDMATVAGIFEALAGCFFITVALAFIGLILLTPAEILEIIILYKASEELKQ